MNNNKNNNGLFYAFVEEMFGSTPNFDADLEMFGGKWRQNWSADGGLNLTLCGHKSIYVIIWRYIHDEFTLFSCSPVLINCCNRKLSFLFWLSRQNCLTKVQYKPFADSSLTDPVYGLCAQKLPFHNLGKNRPIVVNDRWWNSSFVNKHVCRSSLCKVMFVPLGFDYFLWYSWNPVENKFFYVMHRFTVCQLWHTIQLSSI